MSVFTEVHDAIAKGVDNIEGWVADVKAKLPAAIETAQKLQNSPIAQALEGAVLPPAVEAEIAKLIGEASAAFAEHGTVTVSGTATPAPSDTASPAEPAAPATPAEPTPTTETPAA